MIFRLSIVVIVVFGLKLLVVTNFVRLGRTQNGGRLSWGDVRLRLGFENFGRASLSKGNPSKS